MRICLVAPVKATPVSGNDVTAGRWTRMLTELGHRVDRVGPDDELPDADLLLALHARRSARAVDAFRNAHPHRPIVLALTGTDLYRDLKDGSPPARRSVELADRYVVLQPRGLEALPAGAAERAHVVRQSAVPPEDPPGRPTDHLAAVVLAHLRPVKDPLLAAQAVRRLPDAARVRVRHYGAGLDAGLAEQAREETATNPRYEWCGEVSRERAVRELAGSHVLVLASRLEGGANVVSEAIVCGVPVLASRVEGTVGVLGQDYPGFFPVGDAGELARLLSRMGDDRDGLRSRLATHVQARQSAHSPRRERAALAALVAAVREGSAPDGQVDRPDAGGGGDRSRGQ